MAVDHQRHVDQIAYPAHKMLHARRASVAVFVEDQQVDAGPRRNRVELLQNLPRRARYVGMTVGHAQAAALGILDHFNRARDQRLPGRAKLHDLLVRRPDEDRMLENVDLRHFKLLAPVHVPLPVRRPDAGKAGDRQFRDLAPDQFGRLVVALLRADIADIDLLHAGLVQLFGDPHFVSRRHRQSGRLLTLADRGVAHIEAVRQIERAAHLLGVHVAIQAPLVGHVVRPELRP